jgi:hypothetical protein
MQKRSTLAKKKYFSRRSWCYVRQLRLAEVCGRPPLPGIDQRKELCADVNIGSLRGVQVVYVTIEGSMDATVVEVILCLPNRGRSLFALRGQRIQNGDCVICLIALLLAHRHIGDGLLKVLVGACDLLA